MTGKEAPLVNKPDVVDEGMVVEKISCPSCPCGLSVVPTESSQEVNKVKDSSELHAENNMDSSEPSSVVLEHLTDKADESKPVVGSTANETPIIEDGTLPKTTTLKACLTCAKPCVEVVSCDKCSTGSFCSLVCKDKHDNHTQYCPLICSLESLETEKRMRAEVFSVDSEKLKTPITLELSSVQW